MSVRVYDIIWLHLWVLTPFGLSYAQAPLNPWLTESQFVNAIDRTLTATRDLPTPIKPFLLLLSQERKVAILIDRRIDPSRSIRVNLLATPFHRCIAELADQSEGGVSILADTLIVAPRRVAAQLRTIAWLRKVELKDVAGADTGREFELVRRRPLHWEDLTEPRMLVEHVAQSYGLAVSGLELIAYDLWGAGDIANPNAAEALSILLAQFDLSFEWTAGATGIRIVQAPGRVTIRKEYAVAKNRRGRVLEDLALELPEAAGTLDGGRLTLDATLEEHEAAVDLIKGTRNDAREPAPVLLVQKRFSLKMEREPAGNLLVTLQAQGVDVRFDASQLKQAGVDLRKSVSLNVTQVPIGTLLGALCEQVPGLSYRLDGETIYMEITP